MAVTVTSVGQENDSQKAVASVTLAAADTLTPNVDLFDTYLVAMPAGNITIANPSGAKIGAVLRFKITQDGVGSRTITWGAAFKKNLTLTTTAAASDTVAFMFDGTNWNQIAQTLNVA